MLWTNSQAAGLALQVLYAMDMHVADRNNLTPAVDPRLVDWTVLGYISGADALFRRGRTLDTGQPVCYGYVAQNKHNPSQYVTVIRGTEGLLEWAEDGQFLAVPHPSGGKVEAGFYGIYTGFKFWALGHGPVAAPLGTAALVGDQGVMTVVGHSLGGPLATYLAYDLAKLLGARVQLCALASPRPGNADFARALAAAVPAHVVYNYVLDVVPRVPFGFGYCDLPNVVWLTPSTVAARIAFDLDCHHHAVCYAALLDYAVAAWADFPPFDHPCTVCIKGPA